MTASTTTSFAATTPHDTRALVAAVLHNTEADGVNRFLDPVRWSVISDYLTSAQLPRGHLLMSQGDHDGRLYFIESGDLKVDMKTPSGLVHLAILGPGSVVGEGGFFTLQARNASVSVFNDCTVWTLTPASFQSLVQHHPAVAVSLSMALGAVLATRMLDISKRIAVL